MTGQFLTDDEYAAVRKDMCTIVSDIKPKLVYNGYGLDHIVLEGFEQAIDKLTAYVDQKIARYY